MSVTTTNIGVTISEHFANLDEFSDVLVRIGPRTSFKLAVFDHRKVMTFNGEVVSKVNRDDSCLGRCKRWYKKTFRAAQKISSRAVETASRVASGDLVFARDEPAGSNGQSDSWLVLVERKLKNLLQTRFGDIGLVQAQNLKLKHEQIPGNGAKNLMRAIRISFKFITRIPNFLATHKSKCTRPLIARDLMSFYEDAHKQALGYQNPFYLKKDQRIKPTLYDGHVMSKQHNVISMHDSEETLSLAEESRVKMSEKQNDPISKDKKVNISPIDYAKLNKLSKDFGKHFVLQKELSAAQFSKAKNHLASFDKVINVRTTHDPITEVTWGFERTKGVFNMEVIPFVKKLWDLFNNFDKELHIENESLLAHIIFQDVVNIVIHADVKSEFMLHVQNNFLDDNIALEMLKIENDRLMELLISQDLVHTTVNSFAAINDFESMQQSYVDEYTENLKLKLEAKDVSIEKLKKHIATLKGQSVVESAKSNNVIPSKMYKLDLPPLSSKLRNNREAYVDYLKVTQEHTHTLHDLVEHARARHPVDSELHYACQYVQ
ncbi:hypothetical protein Tco_0863649 [Tanacetum coccineum]